MNVEEISHMIASIFQVLLFQSIINMYFHFSEALNVAFEMQVFQGLHVYTIVQILIAQSFFKQNQCLKMPTILKL